MTFSSSSSYLDVIFEGAWNQLWNRLTLNIEAPIHFVFLTPTMLSPPLLNHKITDPPVSQPASDRAAHGPIISRIGDVNSNPTTPGLHVPGSFPDLNPKSDVQQDIQYAKDTAISALQSAKEYVSTSVEDVKRLMEDTGDKVGGYLPQSVNAYLR